jgi:hypothetical protein
MNIYQKLKESGYNTDGLASPLKYDGPKKRVKKKSLTPEQKEKMKREEFERRASHAQGMSRKRK